MTKEQRDNGNNGRIENIDELIEEANYRRRREAEERQRRREFYWKLMAWVALGGLLISVISLFVTVLFFILRG